MPSASAGPPAMGTRHTPSRPRRSRPRRREGEGSSLVGVTEPAAEEVDALLDMDVPRSVVGVHEVVARTADRCRESGEQLGEQLGLRQSGRLRDAGDGRVAVQ